MFASYIPNKGLQSRLYKELLQLNHKNTKDPIKHTHTHTHRNDLNRHPKKICKWPISIYKDAGHH